MTTLALVSSSYFLYGPRISAANGDLFIGHYDNFHEEVLCTIRVKRLWCF